MPNWVHNTLKCYVTDPQALIEELGAEHDVLVTIRTENGITTYTDTCREPFCFWNIYRPEGEALCKYEESLKAPSSSPYWYEWNLDHWGTKWEPIDVEITVGFFITITFSTAWAPPIFAVHRLAAKHPDDQFHLRYIEEQGWGGFVRFKGDKWHEDTSWPIPSSHLDAVRIENYCACFDVEYDGFRPFSDCPMPFTALSMAAAS